MKSIRSEVLRFIAVGVLNTGMTYLLYLLLLRVVPYLVAYTTVFAVGIIVSYFLNAKVVFQAKITMRSAVRYPAVYLVQYALGASLLYVLVGRYSVSKELASLVVLAASASVTFVLTRIIMVSGPLIRKP